MRQVVLALALLAVAGCGDAADGIASLSETAASTSGGQEGFDAETALLAFTQCLRTEGLNVPDPEFDAEGNLRFTPGNDAVDIDELLAARDSCSEYLDGVTLELFGFDQTELEDNLFAYAKCMRANDFDLPDPDLDNTLRRLLGPGPQNTQGFAGIGPFGDVDVEDPAFIAADGVCRPGIFADFGPPQDSS